MSRLLALALVLVLLLSGAALAARGDPQKRITPADQKRAKAMLLRKSDFGPTFRTVALPPIGSDNFDFYCAALDESDLVVTGEARSAAFAGAFETYNSASQIYSTAAAARTSWRRGTSKAGLQCAVQAFRKLSQRERVAFVSYRKIAFPSVAPRTVAFRWISTANRVRIYADIVLLMRGRAHVVAYFVSPVAPIDRVQQVSLTRKLSARMAKTMRGA